MAGIDARNANAPPLRAVAYEILFQEQGSTHPFMPSIVSGACFSLTRELAQHVEQVSSRRVATALESEPVSIPGSPRATGRRHRRSCAGALFAAASRARFERGG